MAMPSRNRTTFSALTLALTIPLAGCFGPSDDKGDNPTNRPFTPKPSTVEDANTAGDRKTVLPVPTPPEVKAGDPASPAPSPN